MDQPPPSGNPQLSAHIDHNRFVGRTRVAYFSMEIAISPEMPTYSGGPPERFARSVGPALCALPLPAMVAVPIAERAVWVRPWLHVLQCPTGGAVPILLLDTDVSENDPDDRGITSRLYGGDATLRLKQEIVLGIGGEMLLRALGFEIATYHLNEGHAALLPLALLRRYPQAAASPEGTFPYDLQPVRERCVFTNPHSGRRGP